MKNAVHKLLQKPYMKNVVHDYYENLNEVCCLLWLLWLLLWLLSSNIDK